MENESVKTKFLRWADAYNNMQTDRFDQVTDDLFAEDLILHASYIPSIKPGIAGQKEIQAETFRIYSTGHLAIDEILEDGDRLITRSSFKGANSITGTEDRIVFIEIYRVVEGKIAEMWSAASPGSW